MLMPKARPGTVGSYSRSQTYTHTIYIRACMHVLWGRKYTCVRARTLIILGRPAPPLALVRAYHSCVPYGSRPLLR